MTWLGPGNVRERPDESAKILETCHCMGRAIALQGENFNQFGCFVQEEVPWSNLDKAIEAIQFHASAKNNIVSMQITYLVRNPLLLLLQVLDEMAEFDRPQLFSTKAGTITEIEEIQVQDDTGNPEFSYPIRCAGIHEPDLVRCASLFGIGLNGW